MTKEYYDSDDKAMRLQAAYHIQQAVEKIIKLKAEMKGKNLWGHDIVKLIDQCDKYELDIEVPDYIRKKTAQITMWEAECRYYPVSVVRKKTLSLYAM